MNFQALINASPSKSDQARLKLLAAGLELFGKSGPDGTTVRDIAKAAGQNVAAIAYYFGSKEKLYDAVIEGVMNEMRQRMADVFAEIAELQRQPEPRPEEASRLLQKFLREVFLRLLSCDEAVAVGRILVREQLQPSAGFETFYHRGFLPLHQSLAFLVGTLLHLDPKAQETAIRTNSIMGQVYFFMMTREAILRRLGWKTFEGRHAELVSAILSEHVETLLAGLSASANCKFKSTSKNCKARPA